MGRRPSLVGDPMLRVTQLSIQVTVSWFAFRVRCLPEQPKVSPWVRADQRLAMSLKWPGDLQYLGHDGRQPLVV